MAANAKENNVRKIRKFGAGGSTEEDAQEARDKVSGLAASNAELERGDRKPSGFLGLGRFLQGNIDQKGSEAYNLYGAGYGREVDAKNARLKGITEAETKAPAAPAPAPAPAPLTAARNAKASADRAKAAADNLTKRGGREEDGAAPEADSTGLTKRGGREEDKAVPKATKAAPKAASKAAPEAAKTDTSKAFGKEQQYQRAQEAAQTPEGQAKRKKIIESQAIENFSPELEVAGGLGGLGLKAAAKLLKRGSGKGFFRKDPEFDYPRVRRGELPAPKKSDSANPSNLSLPKPASRLGLPRPKGDDIADVVAKRKGGSVQGYASGGSVAASSRGDGIAQRGKTRGRMR